MILEFHSFELFRNTLSFKSYMQRYEELNKVGEGRSLFAASIFQVLTELYTRREIPSPVCILFSFRYG